MNRNSRTFTQLTAPGTTSHFVLSSASPSQSYFKVVIASINTSLVLRAESTDGTNLVSRSVDYTITANGTYQIPVLRDGTHARLNFVSEVGGTAVTVDGSLVETYQ